MDEKELKEIFEFLQKAGANPMICDTDVPYFEASPPRVANTRQNHPLELEETGHDREAEPERMAEEEIKRKEAFRDGGLPCYCQSVKEFPDKISFSMSATFTADS